MPARTHSKRSNPGYYYYCCTIRNNRRGPQHCTQPKNETIMIVELSTTVVVSFEGYIWVQTMPRSRKVQYK